MNNAVMFLLGLLIGVLLTERLWPDPYHIKRRVSFWMWLYRELDELIHGEKN